jgi:PPOX class probable F420-dependent enzyme
MTEALTTLKPRIRDFLSTGRHFATIATIDADGTPRQALIWYRMDGDDIIINSLVGRRWPTNLLRDPRISVAVTHSDDGYRWVGIVGSAEPITDQASAQADIAAMARHYHADEPDEAETMIATRFEKQERISFRIRAANVHDHLD